MPIAFGTGIGEVAIDQIENVGSGGDGPVTVSVEGFSLGHHGGHQGLEVLGLDSLSPQHPSHGRPDACFHVVAMGLSPIRPTAAG